MNAKLQRTGISYVTPLGPLLWPMSSQHRGVIVDTTSPGQSPGHGQVCRDAIAFGLNSDTVPTTCTSCPWGPRQLPIERWPCWWREGALRRGRFPAFTAASAEGARSGLGPCPGQSRKGFRTLGQQLRGHRQPGFQWLGKTLRMMGEADLGCGGLQDAHCRDRRRAHRHYGRLLRLYGAAALA